MLQKRDVLGGRSYRGGGIMAFLLNMESKTPLADAIKNVVFEERRNFSIIITGKPQMRKSTTALRLAIDINPKFNFERDFAILKTKEYLDVLNLSGPRGTVKILDEFGVGMNHREWHDFLNQAMSFIMQTHGHEGLILIVTSPYEDYVDVDARKLFDAIIEMVRKEEEEKYALGKVQLVQYNQKLKKIYYRFPRGRFPNGIVKRIPYFKFRFPPDDIMKTYFEISKPKKEELKQELAKKAEMREKKQEAFSPEKYVEMLKNMPEIWRERAGKKYVPLEMVMAKTGLMSVVKAKIVKLMLEERYAEIQEGNQQAD